MLGKRTVAAIVALMLVLGMGATTLMALMPQQSSSNPGLSEDMAPVIEKVWSDDVAARGALPAAVAQSVVGAKQAYADSGYEVTRSSVTVRPLKNEVWEVYTTLDLTGPDGPTLAGWGEFFKTVDGVVVPVSDEEALA